MVQRHFPEPETEPLIRLTMPAESGFAAVAATAAEVLLAGRTQDPDAIVSAVREAVTTLLGAGAGDGDAELEIARTGDRLTVTVPVAEGGPGSAPRGALAELADELAPAGDRIALTWRIPGS